MNGGMSFEVAPKPPSMASRPTPDALLDGGVAGEDAVVAKADVAGHQGAVDHGAAVADLGVMADVGADHEHVPVADGGHPVALHRSRDGP